VEELRECWVLALGHLHAAGFAHGDLYSKHVLVRAGPRFCFLDWQRARLWKKVPIAIRQMDLATLDATMPDTLAGDRMRLACLRAYLVKARDAHGNRGPVLFGVLA